MMSSPPSCSPSDETSPTSSSAQSSSTSGSVAVNTSAASECPLCLGPFNQPRNLPCGHTVCHDCLPLLQRYHAPALPSSSAAASEPAPLIADDMRLCYSGCATPFSISNLPRAYALDALVNSRLPVDTIAAWRPPQIHELYLIDTSSSMWYSDRFLAFMVGGSRLSVAKDFVKKAILSRRGHPGHWVSVYTFDTECRPLVRLEAGERGLTTAAATLRNLQPDGKQTALLDAVSHCYDALRGYPERTKRLIILTDGADTISANGNKERHASLASELAGRGRELRVTTVLFNVGGNTTRSKQTADQLGAAFVDITEKMWRRKADHYLATYPNTTEIHQQFLAAQREDHTVADIAAMLVPSHSLPLPPASVSSSSSSMSLSSSPAIRAMDVEDSSSPAVTPAATIPTKRVHVAV